METLRKYGSSFLHLNWNIRIFYFGLLLLFIGIPVSRFLISISYAFLGLGWVLTPDHIDRLKKLWSNKVAFFLLIIYAIHLLGLLWSTDLTYGLKDLKTKLPLLLFPFFYATMPIIEANWRRFFLNIFSLTCLVSVGIVLARIVASSNDWWGIHITDFRDASIYVSHIRLSLMVVFVFLLVCFKPSELGWNKWLRGISLAPLLLYLVFMQSMTGIAILIVLFPLLVIYKYKRQKGLLIAVIGVFGLILFLTYRTMQDNYESFAIEVKDELNLPMKSTRNGNHYIHLDNNSKENGYFVYRNICKKELATAWNQVSTIPFDGDDLRDNKIRFTIYRYMSSKGFPKDGEHVQQLSELDIEAIQNGVPNYRLLEMNPVEKRLYALSFEIHQYLNTGIANGHSLTQRFEYFKTGVKIFQNNWLIGVGTGDVPDAYSYQYEKDQSPLDEKFRLRSHNQWLSLLIAFGVLGFSLIGFGFVSPFIWMPQAKSLSYIIFALILYASFFTEDTLETQFGVTLYSGLGGLLLFSRKDT